MFWFLQFQASNRQCSALGRRLFWSQALLPALGSENGGLGMVGDAFLVAHCRDLMSGGTVAEEEVSWHGDLCLCAVYLGMSY